MKQKWVLKSAKVVMAPFNHEIFLHLRRNETNARVLIHRIFSIRNSRSQYLVYCIAIQLPQHKIMECTYPCPHFKGALTTMRLKLSYSQLYSHRSQYVAIRACYWLEVKMHPNPFCVRESAVALWQYLSKYQCKYFQQSCTGLYYRVFRGVTKGKKHRFSACPPHQTIIWTCKYISSIYHMYLMWRIKYYIYFFITKFLSHLVQGDWRYWMLSFAVVSMKSVSMIIFTCMASLFGSG